MPTNYFFLCFGSKFQFSTASDVKKLKKMRFGGLPGLKSTPKIFSAPKKNLILAEKKISIFRKSSTKIFFSPKIEFFFGAQKMFGVDLSMGKPPNRIFLVPGPHNSVLRYARSEKNPKNAVS